MFAGSTQAQGLQFASLGDFQLENGQAIRDCKIGYRTFGTLNANKSNAILFPTWFTGKTSNLAAGLIGPGNLADPVKYFVIAVDAIGDGVSSAPSNSKEQPRMQFPKFTIRDMVNSQRRLVVEVLHIAHLKAVMGISMGGMQTFEWVVDYPDLMDKAIPIVGSPRLTSFDELLWETELHAIESDRDWNGGNYTSPPPLKALADIHNLALTTPAHRVHETSRSQFEPFLAQVEKNGPDRFDANDWYRQLQAMLSLDVAARFGGSLESAVGRVKAQLLVISALQDHMVNPIPALAFAKLAHGRVLELTGDCGHLATNCEKDAIVRAAAKFLAE